MRPCYAYSIATEITGFTIEKGVKDFTCWFRGNKESFAKDFMIITGFFL